jgi:hypothetical protein
MNILIFFPNNKYISHETHRQPPAAAVRWLVRSCRGGTQKVLGMVSGNA